MQRKKHSHLLVFIKQSNKKKAIKNVLPFGRRHIVKDSPISFKPNNLKTPWNKQLLINKIGAFGICENKKVIVLSTRLLDYTMVEKS